MAFIPGGRGPGAMAVMSRRSQCLPLAKYVRGPRASSTHPVGPGSVEAAVCYRSSGVLCGEETVAEVQGGAQLVCC